MKNKLILFDWGNIVESHQTGYPCYTGWNDLIEACGYKYKEDTINITLLKYFLHDLIIAYFASFFKFF